MTLCRCSVVAEPTFIYGPKDGAQVPPVFWALDTIELVQHMENGTDLIYFYQLDEESKNYIYQGQAEG